MHMIDMLKPKKIENTIRNHCGYH